MLEGGPAQPVPSPEVLLAGIAAEFASEVTVEVLMEAADLLEVEHGRAQLTDRLQPGQPVVIGLGSGSVHGVIRCTGPEVIVMAAPDARHVIARGAVDWVRGAGFGLAAEGAVSTRVTLASCLRELIGECVQISARSLMIRHAEVLAVYADHLEVRETAPAVDRERSDATILTLPFDSITCVTSRHRTDATERTPWSGDTSW